MSEHDQREAALDAIARVYLEAEGENVDGYYVMGLRDAFTAVAGMEGAWSIGMSMDAMFTRAEAINKSDAA